MMEVSFSGGMIYGVLGYPVAGYFQISRPSCLLHPERQSFRMEKMDRTATW